VLLLLYKELREASSQTQTKIWHQLSAYGCAVLERQLQTCFDFPQLYASFFSVPLLLSPASVPFQTASSARFQSISKNFRYFFCFLFFLLSLKQHDRHGLALAVEGEFRAANSFLTIFNLNLG
jgi:hypothetical protein